MELELRLKITHNRDDLSTQMTDLRITKDIPGSLFMSTETDSKFILIGHLKGFRRENIDIDINEDGSMIVISGKKPVQELELMGWIIHKKEVEIRAFRKVFQIPNGVILDKIKVKFKDEISTLTIFLPKLVKGLCGVGIEEVQEANVNGDRPETTQTGADKVPESERAKEEIEQESKKPSEVEEIDQVVERQVGPAEPEVRKVVGDEVPEKDSRLVAPKEGTVEQKIEGIENSGPVVEEAIDQGQPEATKAVSEKLPGRDETGETVQEKPGEAKEEIHSVVQEVKAGVSRKRQNAARAVPKRDQGSLQKESREPEVKSSEENDQIVEESHGRPDVEPQASIEKVKPEIRQQPHQETASMKPQKEAEEIERSQPPEPPTIEQTHKEKLPEERTPEQVSEEQVQGLESIESTSPENDQATAGLESPSSTSTKDEKGHPISENDQVRNEMPEELPKQEPRAEVQESTKPESCQQSEQEETSHPKDLTEDTNKDDFQAKEETQGNEIEEKATCEENLPKEKVDEHGTHEMEKQKGLSDKPADASNHAQKKCKMSTHLVVAGSAFIVSIIVLVFHLIRAKKRYTKC